MKPKHHFFVCMNQRPPGHPRGSCGAAGASTVFEAFAGEVEQQALYEEVMVTGTFCMGPCDQGPTVVAYPEGIWYGSVTPADVPEIIKQHRAGGVVERLQIP